MQLTVMLEALRDAGQVGLVRKPASAAFLTPAERRDLQQRQDAEQHRARLACPAGGRWYGAACANLACVVPCERG